MTTGADGLAQVQATANATAGTYQVLADAGLGTPVAFDLANLPAAPALLVKVAGDGQSAPVGGTVAIAPQVRVEDAQGNPVAGAVVSFTAGPGGGSVTGATVVTGADGLAAVGSWTLGGEGGHVLDAALPGTPSVAAVQFAATALASLDVGVTVSSTSDYARVGAIHDHVVVVTNHGNGALTGVAVEVPVPDGHAAATAQWLCIPTGGASCGGASDGTGAIDLLVDLPVGASVILLTAAEVLGNPSEEIVFEATVTAAGDTIPGNDADQAVTPVVLFRNGFEAGGDGANGDGAPAFELAPDGTVLVVPLAARSGGALPGAWLHGSDGHGRVLFAIDRVTVAGRTWVRASAGAPGAWLPADTAVGLALLDAGEGAVLVVDSGARQAELPLAGPLAGPVAVRVVAD